MLRRGRVVDADGRPVPGALVSVISGTEAMPEIGRRTDAAGFFHVGLPAGTYRLAAVTDDRLGEVEVDGGVGGDIVIHVKAR